MRYCQLFLFVVLVFLSSSCKNENPNFQTPTGNPIECNEENKYFVFDRNDRLYLTRKLISISSADQILLSEEKTNGGIIINKSKQYNVDSDCESLLTITEFRGAGSFSKFTGESYLEVPSGAIINQYCAIEFLGRDTLNVDLDVPEVDRIWFPNNYHVDTISFQPNNYSFEIVLERNRAQLVAVQFESDPEVYGKIFDVNQSDSTITLEDLNIMVAHRTILKADFDFLNYNIFANWNGKQVMLHSEIKNNFIAPDTILSYVLEVDANSMYRIGLNDVIFSSHGYFDDVSVIPESIDFNAATSTMQRVGKEFRVSIPDEADWVEAIFRYRDENIRVGEWKIFSRYKNELIFTIPPIRESFLEEHQNIREFLNVGPDELIIKTYKFGDESTKVKLRDSPSSLMDGLKLYEFSSKYVGVSFEL